MKCTVPPSPPSPEVLELLGPLRDLVGTWEGALGFNVVVVPAILPTFTSGPADRGFQLLPDRNFPSDPGHGNNYTEVITFCPIGELVKNRGFTSDSFEPNSLNAAEKDEIVAGLQYSLQIYEVIDGQRTDTLLHTENGMWMHMVNKSDRYRPWQVARMASIPHGATVNAVGNASEWSTASIEALNEQIESEKERFSPFPIGFCDTFGTREHPATIGGLTGELHAIADAEPLSRLTAANKQEGLRLSKVSQLNVKTADGYGIVGNQPFLRAQAHVTDFEANFYLQTLEGEEEPTRLQYMQRQTITFNNQRDCRRDDHTGDLWGAKFYNPLTGLLNVSKLPTHYNRATGKFDPPSAACLAKQPATLDELHEACSGAAFFERWPHIEVNTLTKRKTPLPCVATNLF